MNVNMTTYLYAACCQVDRYSGMLFQAANVSKMQAGSGCSAAETITYYRLYIYYIYMGKL